MFRIAAARIAVRSESEDDGDGVGVGEVEGLTIELKTFTPLFQTSLVPELIQVYRIPDKTVVEPSLLQEVPAFVAALAGALSWASRSEAHIRASKRSFITI